MTRDTLREVIRAVCETRWPVWNWYVQERGDHIHVSACTSGFTMRHDCDLECAKMRDENTAAQYIGQQLDAFVAEQLT